MWLEVIELGNLTESIVYGEVVKEWTWREIYANKKFVRQSEKYQAAMAGLKPELMFEVNDLDFENDERVRFNGKIYEITRTGGKDYIVELVVSAMVGGEV